MNTGSANPAMTNKTTIQMTILTNLLFLIALFNQIGGAFGAPPLGTALVVHFDTLTMTKGSPSRLLSLESVESANDYQSGPKPLRPKGYRHFM